MTIQEFESLQRERTRLENAAVYLAEALVVIYNAHASGNNGAFMGEAVLCRSFALRAREALEHAGLMIPGADWARQPRVLP